MENFVNNRLRLERHNGKEILVHKARPSSIATIIAAETIDATAFLMNHSKKTVMAGFRPGAIYRPNPNGEGGRILSHEEIRACARGYSAYIQDLINKESNKHIIKSPGYTEL